MGLTKQQRTEIADSEPVISRLIVLNRGRLSDLPALPASYELRHVDNLEQGWELLSVLPGCMVVDCDLPKLPEQIKKLVAQWIPLTILGCSSDHSVQSIVRCIKMGCYDFVPRNVSREDLRIAIDSAIRADQQGEESAFSFRKRIAKLTDREREVLGYFVDGQNTKMIASHLQVSYQTIDKHRNRGLKKMGATSLTSLAASLPKLS